MEAIGNGVTLYFMKIVVAIVIFVVGRFLAGHVTELLVKLLNKKNVETTLVNFLKNIAYYVLLIAIIIAALNHLGINTTSLLTIVGAAGLAIGLALKDSLSNFSSGVMLVFFRPFPIPL